MSAHKITLPELDQRLRDERNALGRTLDRLRGRMRHELNPGVQLRRRPGPALALAALAGLLAGHRARRLFR